ncbi:MAG: hypothetical protein Ct9H300mP5_1580 [Candidatus Pelagibacterales bacterium]|nr:MAG: hypothetical protein Ct9H300mP5_1580 [Pelagibacterales bacterium]
MLASLIVQCQLNRLVGLKKKFKKSSQMKGLKYRTVGLAADVFGEMGMSVVQLPVEKFNQQ